MKSQYYEAWEAMNNLQEHSSKLNTIKELIDTTIKNTDDENILSLLEATSVILDVYVDEFDDLFRNAWNKTISKGYEDSNKSFNDALDNIDTQNDGVLLNKDREIKNKIQSSWDDEDIAAIIGERNGRSLICDKNDPSPECKKEWTKFWEDEPYPIHVSEDGDVWIPDSVVKKEDKVVKWQLPIEVDGISGEYYIQFPDDLMEAAGIEENDTVEWIERDDGSFLLRKVNGTK